MIYDRIGRDLHDFPRINSHRWAGNKSLPAQGNPLYIHREGSTDKISLLYFLFFTFHSQLHISLTPALFNKSRRKQPADNVKNDTGRNAWHSFFMYIFFRLMKKNYSTSGIRRGDLFINLNFENRCVRFVFRWRGVHDLCASWWPVTTWRGDDPIYKNSRWHRVWMS